MKYLKDDIINSEDVDIEDLTNRVDISHLLYFLVMRRFEFDMIYVNKNRIEIEINIKSAKKPNKKRNEKLNLCNKELPICIHDKDEVQNFTILKVYDLPVIIDNYFSECENKSRLVNSANDVYKDLLIERRVHYCKIDYKKSMNHSFTASHPIFSDIVSNQYKRKSTATRCMYTVN
jgi:hypothetical protein